MSTPISRSNALSPDTQPTAVILGGRSWVGYRLAESLCAHGIRSLCTTSKSTNEIDHANDQVTYVQTQSSEHVQSLILKTAPEMVVNLLLGTEESDFQSHQLAAQATMHAGGHYTYASSALALDGYKDTELVESLSPRSVSDYGKFKGRCEEYLNTLRDLPSLVLRFASIHGAAPWKSSRTQAFLQRMTDGEQVTVHRGVVQNRVTDRYLAETIANLMNRRSTGVAHIGASDWSEETTFLRSLAKQFGYDPALVLDGDLRNVNLAVVPGLGVHPNGPVPESETLKSLLTYDELKEHRQTLDAENSK